MDPAPASPAPDAEPGVEEAVLAALAGGPRTAFEIARAVEAADPGCLEGREGELHPLLADLVRRGAAESRWTEDAAGRPRREYALPGAPAGPAPAAPAPPVADPLLARVAADASRSVPDDFEREAARAAMLAHLEASAAGWARLGLGPAEAARRAAADFGDPWRIRTDLGRVHRGRSVVLFPRTRGAWLRALAIHELPALAILLAIVLLLRWQVVQAYNIPTGSMEPTLHGDESDGDLILVDKTAFLRHDPHRWDIVVFYPPPEAEARPEGDGGSPTAFVKRCVGLGGESLDIHGGDLYVDGRLARRPPGVEEAMMVLLYDQARDFAGAAARTRLGAPPADLVLGTTWDLPTTGTWAVRDLALEASPGPEGEARLRYLPEIRNSLPYSLARTKEYYADVGDAEVRFVARPGAAGAVVGADLTEGEERHAVRVGPAGVVLRSGGTTRTFPGARTAAGRPVEVRFRNVDDRLTAWVDGEMVLREEMPLRAALPDRARPAGVELVVEGGPASFEGVRIRRDVHYLRDGTAPWPRSIPEGHVFMMGDNTGSSRDSRFWGPVPERDLIGVPFWIVYPPTRVRVLR